MPYVLATINGGGFIKLLDKRSTIHRETLSLHTSGESCYAALEAAKANVKAAKVFETEDALILQLRKDGGVESLWALPGAYERAKTRLRIWSGCYGAWPLRKLNG